MVSLLVAVAIEPAAAPAWLVKQYAPGQADEALPDGGVSLQPPSPEGVGVGGGASLVPCKSITSTVHQLPSQLAQQALDDLVALPDGDARRGLEKVLVCKEFVEYLDLCEQKGFVIKGYDTRKGKFVKHLIGYENRWGDKRRKDLSGKLQRLQHWFELMKDRPVTMVTLTSYHGGHSIPQAWEKLNKGRVKILKLIAKYFNSPDYFWVAEPHKSGYVHYHIAVFADVSNERKDGKGKGIEDKFRDLWSRKYGVGNHTYGLDFSQKKDGDKIKHLKSYLSKYLQKGFLIDKWTPGLLIFNAYLHYTGYRMYGASTGIREVMNVEDKEDNQTVWLETRIEGPGKDKDTGEIFTEDRVIWYRQYIPDWLDSQFWLRPDGGVRWEDPPETYIFDWGRRLIPYGTSRYMDIKQYKAINSIR